MKGLRVEGWGTGRLDLRKVEASFRGPWGGLRCCGVGDRGLGFGWFWQFGGSGGFGDTGGVGVGLQGALRTH